MIEVSKELLGGNAAGVEEIDPIRGVWRVRFGRESGEGGTQTCLYADFEHKPTDGEITRLITGHYDNECDAECEWGMRYKGLIVYLSDENKFNFKAAFDIAARDPDKSFPLTFKFWKDERTPVYWEFRTLDELSEFYVSAMQHLMATYNKWWAKKDREIMRLIDGYKPLTRDKIEKGGEP